MHKNFRRFMALLPKSLQHELRRYYYFSQILFKKFKSEEPEWMILEKYLVKGDWAIDVGANVGHYTAKISNIVKTNGRVIAFEPIPKTFDLLASNMSHLKFNNITLINAAASDCASCVGFKIPKFSTGLDNYYRAHISNSTLLEYIILSMSIDSICLNSPISLIKIDAEGHDFQVIKGAIKIIKRDKPTLIVEGRDINVFNMLLDIGYSSTILPDSPNTIFHFE